MVQKVIPKSKLFTRPRLILLMTVLAMLGCVIAAGSILGGVLQGRIDNKRNAAMKITRRLLTESQMLGSKYVTSRMLARKRLSAQLDKQASTVSSDIQVFLQAAFVKHESEQLAKRNKEIKRQREKIAAFALAGLSEMLSEIGTLEQEVKSLKEGGVDSGDYLSSGEDMELGEQSGIVTISPEDKEDDIAAELLKPNRQEEFSRQLMQLKSYLEDDDSDKTADWMQDILEKVEPDLITLLPENSNITIAQAGGKILLALGKKAESPETVDGTATRTMLFQSGKESKQWVLRVSLFDPDAPELPNAKEYAGILAASFASLGGDSEITGLIFDASNKLQAFFPDNGGVRPVVPEQGWLEYKNAKIATYYESTVAKEKSEWATGIKLTIDNPPLKTALAEMASENPEYSVVFGAAFLLLIAGIIIVAGLAWNGGERRLVINSAEIDGRFSASNPKPELGSLSRLQLMHRGKKGRASRILDMAQSSALKELVKRVRPVQSAQSAVPPSKPGLREYIK